MGQQPTRHRIASGFAPDVAVAAKSGGPMGIVRNEAAIGRAARTLVDRLREPNG